MPEKSETCIYTKLVPGTTLKPGEVFFRLIERVEMSQDAFAPGISLAQPTGVYQRCCRLQQFPMNATASLRKIGDGEVEQKEE